MTQFTMVDIKDKPQVVSLEWERLEIPDEISDAPDERQDGYWPSLDPENDGFIGRGKTQKDLQEAFNEAQSRMDSWKCGDWGYVGVVARANILIPSCGGFHMLSLQSAGCWGIESDCGDSYKQEVFEDEKANLMAELRTFAAYIQSLPEDKHGGCAHEKDDDGSCMRDHETA